MTIQLDDIRVRSSRYELSLTALTGLTISDIYGYLSNETGEVVWKLTQVVFSNGTAMDVEGEHDFPYLTEGRSKLPPNMDYETLERLDADYREPEDNAS